VTDEAKSGLLQAASVSRNLATRHSALWLFMPYVWASPQCYSSDDPACWRGGIDHVHCLAMGVIAIGIRNAAFCAALFSGQQRTKIGMTMG
jgi:hypothetical protein